MRTISSLSLACVLSFSAPLALALNSPAPNCLPPKCTVTVIVSGNSCAAGIAFSKDPIQNRIGAPVVIEWVLPSDSEWVFDGNRGIVVNMVDSNEITKEGNATHKFAVRNKATRRATYKYDINLVHPQTSATCSLDPIIMTN